MMLAAAVQMTSTSDVERNFAQLEDGVRRAARAGAALITTPEACNYLGPHSEKVRRAESLNGPTITRLAALARELSVHLLVGSFNEKSDEPDRCYNTSVLLSPQGEVLGTYRKMHLFDVDHSAAVRFLESKTCKAGDQPAVIETPLGKIGLAICYDLRFPELFRWQVDHGAEILCVPSAFTATTGAAHWHALLRARAIECQAYVIAPGQVGDHDDEGLRATYGHSLIVDPWGVVIGEASDGPSLALAELDLNRVREVRRAMPLAQHRRL
ncbi:MAG: carbon-nitrogen hydrolase family protein [Deltaproteobacteria bacterium]|nr:MAG: carbon-nitrogen hydrolase family protein [Deltaproteobacteria bacterium]